MANFIYVSEHEDYRGSADGVILRAPSLTNYTVSITSGSISSPSFLSQSRIIRVAADTTCSIAFGTAPTATLTNPRMASNQTEYYAVPSTTNTTFKIAVIGNA